MSRNRHVPHLLAPGVLALTLLSGEPSAFAASGADDLDALVTSLETQKAKLAEQEKRLKQQTEELEAQKAALARQQQQLDALRARIEHTEMTAAPAPARIVAPSRLEQLRGTGAPPGEVAQTPLAIGQVPPPQEQTPEAVGQAPPPQEHPPEVNVISDRGGVLTPKGALVYEPALDFSHTTDSQAVVSGFTVLPALLVGTLDITRVDHDVIQQVNTLRYGLTNRAEIEVRVPYVYGRQETTSRPLDTGSSEDSVTTATGNGLGDVELAGHYQINSGGNDIPFFIGNLRFKSRTGKDPFQVPINPATGLETQDPTGSGFYDIEPSLTAIYPSDPAVFFANLGYLYGLARHVNSPLVGGDGSAEVKPGDAIRFSFGLGFGINEASSFSLGYDYSAFLETKFNNVSQPGTDIQVGSVLIGYSYRFSDRFSANLTTAIGVTADAPNTRVIMRFPIKFQVFDD